MDMRLLMKQAKQMQTKIRETEQNLHAEGTSGGAMVKVVLNGARELVSISIAKSIVESDEDLSMLEDLITAAFKDASTKINKAMAQITGGFNGL
jgi:hypothetical protein